MWPFPKKKQEEPIGWRWTADTTLTPIRDGDYLAGPQAGDPVYGAWGKTRLAILHVLELERRVAELEAQVKKGQA